MQTLVHKAFMRVPAALAALFLSVAAQAGFISLDVYHENLAAGGVSMNAHYDLGSDWNSDCCDPANIRWIQMIKLVNATGGPKTDVPGYPHSTFIDPEPGQPGGPFDSSPFYDFTYSSAAHTTALGGSGAYIVDYPSGWKPFGQMDFLAATLVVCTDETTHTMEMLGGFYWGFNVNADGIIGRQTPSAVPLDALMAEFNTALNQTPAFAVWDMVAGDMDCQLSFIVPGPASITCFTFGMGIFARRRRST